MDQLDALAVALGVGADRRLERALEVVDDRQQILDGVSRGGVGLVAALAIDALAIVVELGRRPQQAILQRVLLAPQLGASIRG